MPPRSTTAPPRKLRIPPKSVKVAAKSGERIPEKSAKSVRRIPEKSAPAKSVKAIAKSVKSAKEETPAGLSIAETKRRARRMAFSRLDAIGIDAMCSYFSSGKSITEFCKEYDIDAFYVRAWIAEDTERALTIVAEKVRTAPERLGDFGIERICRYVSEGGTLAQFAHLHGFWKMDVHRWITENPERNALYVKAREQRADKMVEEILTITDEEPEEMFYYDERGHKRVDYGAIAQKKLRVDTRKWIAAKFSPRNYGDRQVIAGDPENPLVGAKVNADLSRLSADELRLFMELQRKVTEGL